MIPFTATDTEDVESITPWANIGLIVLNFLVFFGELAVGVSGGQDALASFVDHYALVPCEYTVQCAWPRAHRTRSGSRCSRRCSCTVAGNTSWAT
jgi:hypothetical protein